MRIACIGTGTVGRSWAIVFAGAGHATVLWDADKQAVEQSRELIRTTLCDLEHAGMIEDATTVLSRIGFADSLEEAVSDAEYIQESVSERLDVKQALFQRLDALTPSDTIMASSTSAIPGSLFMTGLAGSARCLVAHPLNPPHLIPLVELCATPETSSKSIERTSELLAHAGQRPIRVNGEIEGFVLNRLQWALLSEAMHLIGEGYCSPEDMDAVMTSGLALRWALIGPLAVGHLNAAKGLDGYFSNLREAIGRVQDSLRTDYRPDADTIAHCHAVMSAKMPVEMLPDHQARRDRNIMALRAFLKTTE